VQGFLITVYAYVLKSLKDGKFHYGHTNDLGSRLASHNRGKVKSTKSRKPFILHYRETFETKSEAAKRERFFKSINGYIFLKENKII
jgi:putative endonuclease